jgi:hypothetical protein
LGLGRVKNAAWRITAKLAPEDDVIQGFAAGDPRLLVRDCNGYVLAFGH